MKLHRILAYGLMAAGSLASARNLPRRRTWEQLNHHVALMLDWDDVQAVATRAGAGVDPGDVTGLLRRYREAGATHLSIPELTLNRLLAKGRLSVTAGTSPHRVYFQTQDSNLADRVATELAARLPQVKPVRSGGSRTPTISLVGDLPAVVEVGLGFEPEGVELAGQAGLLPVARPIGYSWVQPEMIERTLGQVAALGIKIIAVQGELVPGHEFRLANTVEAMEHYGLTFAYFSQSRHQRGDWFLARRLAPAGQVILAHEFQPEDLLAEDWFTISRRWVNLAREAGIRLCCLRFFRVIHAADPLESVAYVQELSRALLAAGFSLDGAPGEVKGAAGLPERDELALAGAGVSIAGAAGLAADLLPLPDAVKLGGMGVGALALAGLPFLERGAVSWTGHVHHDHDPSHAHRHPHDHDHPPGHEHTHDPMHDHGHAHGPETAYAPKGLALAAAVAYPAAAAAIDGAGPLAAVAHNLALSGAGAAVLAATTVEREYLLDIEAYRGYHLDWLLPLGLVAGRVLKDRPAWLPLAGAGLAALQRLAGRLGPDLPAELDREHRHAHTHHLSAFQRVVGDAGLALSPRPLRKWSLLAPLGAVSGALLRRQGRADLAAAALTAATAGQIATLAGFRNGQRPLPQTAGGRARGWLVGLGLAGLVWLVLGRHSSRKR